ncbi:pirin family protein [Noviherbaspirillum sedimenti]|uniref:Pirin family protein n=1 Tax=Noviherbaspirillum sedimenti TaxID=2320865 RepID=A0A3A3FY20_9BURK|nr:pirin family protein [Noviherbaspirillum sedimenti]RJG01118.1 pirin family protein [Noviherbaspirillum sedimenti]
MSDIAQLHRMNIGSGFRAYSLRGGEMAAPIDPFLGVDHAWMSVASFPTHPHAGFSAVSYVFLDSETGINNRDSLDTRNRIQPGGLHWTAAGRGVVHDEVPAVSGKTVHMLQIFVNLAVDRQDAEAFALSLEPQDVPVVQLPGAKVRVPLGSFGDAHSPLHPPTEVCLLDISLDQGASLSVPVAAGHSAFIMPIFGTLEIDGLSFDANEPRLPVFPAQTTPREIALQVKDGNAKAVVFSGIPLRQPVHWQGSLALASAEALAARLAAYQRGEFGSL